MKARGISNPVSQKIIKRLYSIKEASVYLGRSVWALREMLWAGKLPYIKDGKRILLDINDMNNWIEQNKTQYSF
jgi:excisionase family DNA binding protein